MIQLVYLLIFAACASLAAVKGGEFKYALKVHPVTLNPITAADNYSVEVMRWMSETLLRHDDETYEWVPLLASRYEVSKDGKTITFEIRKGVKFHDGTSLTAEDVEFSFRVFDMGLYPETGGRDDLKVFDKVEVLNPFKIRFHATRPLFSNLAVLGALSIVPKALYSKKSEIARLNQTIVGTGPYRLKEYHVGTRMILEANPEWWGRSLPEYRDRFNFERIIVRFVEDASLKLQMLEKGDLDYSQLGLDTVLTRTTSKPWGEKVLVEKGNFLGAYTSQSSLFLNLRNPMFAGLKTRRALQMLLNRKLLNEKFFAGKGILATGPWHRLSPYADPALKPVEYDEAQARKLLKEDGWADSDGDGVLDKVIDGKKVDLHFTMLHPVRDQQKMLSLYQEDLKRSGIRMELQQTDWTLFIRNINDLKFDAYILGRGWPGLIDFNPKAEWNSELTHKGEGNVIGYQNKEVDRLMDLAEVELNRDKRIALLRKVYRLIAEDQSQIFTLSDVDVYYAHTSRVKVPRASLKYALGMDRWWIE